MNYDVIKREQVLEKIHLQQLEYGRKFKMDDDFVNKYGELKIPRGWMFYKYRFIFTNEGYTDSRHKYSVKNIACIMEVGFTKKRVRYWQEVDSKSLVDCLYDFYSILKTYENKVAWFPRLNEDENVITALVVHPKKEYRRYIKSINLNKNLKRRKLNKKIVFLIDLERSVSYFINKKIKFLTNSY